MKREQFDIVPIEYIKDVVQITSNKHSEIAVLDGKNIYYADKNFKDEYEIRNFREYIDFKPYLEKMDKKYLTGV